MQEYSSRPLATKGKSDATSANAYLLGRGKLLTHFKETESFHEFPDGGRWQAPLRDKDAYV